MLFFAIWQVDEIFDLLDLYLSFVGWFPYWAFPFHVSTFISCDMDKRNETFVKETVCAGFYTAAIEIMEGAPCAAAITKSEPFASFAHLYLADDLPHPTSTKMRTTKSAIAMTVFTWSALCGILTAMKRNHFHALAKMVGRPTFSPDYPKNHLMERPSRGYNTMRWVCKSCGGLFKR